MRYAIISDIHSNLEAFQAVLEHMEGGGPVEELWCLGDVVGYGPAPNECIQLLRSYPHACIAGNHDWAAIGRVDTSEFNPEAAAAIIWTSRQLTPESRDYLDALPLTLVRGDFTLSHGSPRNPIWEYILSERAASLSFAHFETRYCLAGHSHVPVLFGMDDNGRVSHEGMPEDRSFRLEEGRWILNPGSVGQPRDGDPRASYVAYESDTGEFRSFRVPYDIEATQRKMRKMGLPRMLAERLSYGW